LTLFCGIGCAGAHREVLALAEKLKRRSATRSAASSGWSNDNPYASA